MKARRVWAIARKEILHVWRDPRSLFMALAIPALMLLLFGYALTLDVDQVPLAVWDQARDASSRDLISRFQGSRYFALRHEVQSYAELETLIDRREAMAGLIVPSDFARQLLTGRQPPVQLLVDGTDSNTANLAIGYAEGLVQAHGQRAGLEIARRRFGKAIEPPLDLRARVWYNPEMESRQDIVPGLIAVIMMVIAALLTSLTVAREWETGTMEQLIATPVTAAELVAGKLVPYLALGFADVLLAALMGRYLFHVPFRGSILLLIGLSTLFLVGAMAMGMFFSILTRSQLLATQMAMLATFLPAFLLSGFMYPVANMPGPVQVLTYLVPARYFVSLLRAVYLKGAGLSLLWFDALLLAVFSVVMVALCLRKFHKQLE